MTLITRLFPAFDAGLALKEKALARELDLVARARADGARNHPPVEADQPTEIETTILARGQHAIDEVSQWLKRRFAEHTKSVRALAPTPEERDTEARVSEADFALAKLREENRDRLGALGEAEAATRRELRKFQRDNHLTRSPHYARFPMLVWGTTAVLLFVEGWFNARAFAEVSEYGLIGGWQAAFVYGVINCCLAFGPVGLLGLRNAVHARPMRRLAGSLVALIGVASILVFNGYLGTVRALMATDPDGASLREAVAIFAADPLGFANVPDALQLAAIGLVFALVFALKGFVTFDPYPGYRRVHLAHVQASEAFDAARLAFRNSAERIVNGQIALLDRGLVAAEARNNKAIGHINESEIDATAAETAAVDSAAVAQKLIRRYRDENAAIRSVPSPAYFAEFPLLDRELRGVPRVDFNRHRADLVQDLAQLRQAVGVAKDRLRQMALKALETVRLESEEAQSQGILKAADAAREAEGYVIHVPLRAAE